MKILTRRDFTSVVGTGAAAWSLLRTGSSDGGPLPGPGGAGRLLYTSDPSNIATMQVGRHTKHVPTAEQARADPARAEDLVRWVDNLADNGVDIYAQAVYSQGWSLYFRSPQFEYDARPQHQRFVPMMDSGITPLEVLIDQAHERGMHFFAKFRMSDGHGGSDQGAKFVLENRQWWLEEFPGRLDYSFQPVRDYVFNFADEVVRRFDVDGLMFNYIRWLHCFPREVAQKRQPIMTRWLERIREMLDRRGAEKGKKLKLAVMVPLTLEECHLLGYDVPTWVRQGLIDYVCPCDFKYSDFSAPYDKFSELTRSTNCRLFPSVIPLADGPLLLKPENYRALAQNFYGQGADGVSVFNFQYHWARRTGTTRYPGPPEGYPAALSMLRDLADPANSAVRPREYRYYPLWFARDANHSSANRHRVVESRDESRRLVLQREVGSQGKYQFRACERFSAGTRAVLFVKAQGLQADDEVKIELNGAPIDDFQRVFYEKGRLPRFGRELGPYSTIWCDVTQPPLTTKDNDLVVELTAPGSGEGEIVIDELQLVVVPPLGKK